MALNADDHEQIRQVLARYAIALDQGDFDGVANCFTPSGLFEIDGLPANSPNGGAHHGRDQLRAFAKGMFDAAQGQTRHWISPPAISGDADRATGVAYLMVLRAGQAPNTGVILTGVYRDSFVRDDAGDWLIERCQFMSDPQPQHAELVSTDVLVTRFDAAVRDGARRSA